MAGLLLIDTSFDFRIDSAGRDPDKYSPTLRRYHRLLWSKPLPSGEMFDGRSPSSSFEHREPADLRTAQEGRNQ